MTMFSVIKKSLRICGEIFSLILRNIEIQPREYCPDECRGDTCKRAAYKRHNKACGRKHADYYCNNSARLDRRPEETEYSEHEHKHAKRARQNSVKIEVKKMFKRLSYVSYAECDKDYAYKHLSKASLFSHSVLL